MPAVPVSFTPDLDSAWSVNPGALTSVSGLAPLRNGNYGSMAVSTLFSLTGTDFLHGRMFRQLSGAVRLLIFRAGNIDEYDNAGTRTNRGTSYTATDWDAAAWGNQIIAVDFADAPQSSTGAGFTSLSGSPPKARRVAANQNFVMFADVDDGGSNVYPDMVWWSALRNPASWTPSPATQAGNVRLLDAPGPIKALVAYRDLFVAFKDNAIFVGTYVGPQQYVFNWRMVSNKIGCVAPHSVVECNGKLYFVHNSGFYEFDGQSIRNVGLSVFQSFLNEASAISVPGFGTLPPTSGDTPSSLSKVQATVDDLEGSVWFSIYAIDSVGRSAAYVYGYNVVSGKWGRYGRIGSGGSANLTPFVQASYADMSTFSSSLSSARILAAAVSGSLHYYQYPIASSSVALTTGVLGQNEKSSDVLRVWPRTLTGSSQAPWASGSIAGFTDEAKNITNGTAALTANADFDCLDGKIASKYRTVSLTATESKIVILGGLDIEGAGYPSRR